MTSQDQAMRAFFIGNGIFPNFIKSTVGDFDQTYLKIYRQVAHDLIIVDLQLTYFSISV